MQRHRRLSMPVHLPSGIIPGMLRSPVDTRPSQLILKGLFIRSLHAQGNAIAMAFYQSVFVV
jgi:hypothetical protein